jgi:hypothetical protein
MIRRDHQISFDQIERLIHLPLLLNITSFTQVAVNLDSLFPCSAMKETAVVHEGHSFPVKSVAN